MTPPIKDLLPRLTPILKNRHEKVQENCKPLYLYVCINLKLIYVCRHYHYH